MVALGKGKKVNGMPSASLLFWQNDRMQRLGQVDAHCVATAALTPLNLLLAEESLRAFVMLLSGHFQGFCRDLYAECAQLLVNNVPPGLQGTIQVQCTADLRINRNNPTIDTLRKDFERFASTLDFGANPANGPRVTHLGHLNKWRNAVAHQKATAPAGIPPLILANVQAWLVSCDGLANWLDGIMYDTMRKILGITPW